MALPQFQTGKEVDGQDFALLQNTWATFINPFLARPTNQTNLLKDVRLLVGDNVINHLLSRNMQGWFLTDIQGAAVIYRNAPLNNLTLTLNSSAIVTVSLGVF